MQFSHDLQVHNGLTRQIAVNFYLPRTPEHVCRHNNLFLSAHEFHKKIITLNSIDDFFGLAILGFQCSLFRENFWVLCLEQTKSPFKVSVYIRPNHKRRGLFHFPLSV